MLLTLEKDNVCKRTRVIEGEELKRMLEYPTENFRRVYNPTAWPIEVKVAGNIYRVKGFSISEFETYDVNYVHHLLRKGEKYGLISLAYVKGSREKYPKFNDYFHAQEVKGLQNALKHFEETAQLQRSALNEHMANKTSEQPHVKAKLEKFESMCESLSEWLKEAGSEVKVVDEVEVKTQRPKGLLKTEVKNEPRTNKNKN